MMDVKTFWGCLGLIMIGLKVGGWSTLNWWWTLSPFWGPVVAILILLLAVLLYVYVVTLYRRWKGKGNAAKV